MHVRGLKLNLHGGGWRLSLGVSGPHQVFHKKGVQVFKKVQLIQSSESLITIQNINGWTRLGTRLSFSSLCCFAYSWAMQLSPYMQDMAGCPIARQKNHSVACFSWNWLFTSQIFLFMADFEKRHAWDSTWFRFKLTFRQMLSSTWATVAHKWFKNKTKHPGQQHSKKRWGQKEH